MVLFRGAETHARSVLKAVSWRTLGTLDNVWDQLVHDRPGRNRRIDRRQWRSSPRSPGITCTNGSGPRSPGDAADRASALHAQPAISSPRARKIFRATIAPNENPICKPKLSRFDARQGGYWMRRDHQPIENCSDTTGYTFHFQISNRGGRQACSVKVEASTIQDATMFFRQNWATIEPDGARGFGRRFPRRRQDQADRALMRRSSQLRGHAGEPCDGVHVAQWYRIRRREFAIWNRPFRGRSGYRFRVRPAAFPHP